MSSIKSDGTVIVEGEEVGRLDGFVFTPHVNDGDDDAPVLATDKSSS